MSWWIQRKRYHKESEGTKYLGNIIAEDGTKKLNIKERTNKASWNVNKIVTTLNEKPYGKHLFKAAKLMRRSVLLEGLLTNIEAWINLRKKNLQDLEKQDTILLVSYYLF